MVGSRVMGSFALLACAAFSAEKKIEMKDLPPAVQRAAQEQSKGATVKGFSKEVEDGKTEYEMSLTVNGHNKDISFSAAGKVISVEEEVPLAGIPEAARSAIQKKAGSGTVAIVELVNEGGKTFYEAAIKNGKKSSEFQVGADGKPVK